MERHANKTNVLETVKVPLQRTTKTGRTIFAYLRRSTSKVEQSESLIQQEDGIFSIVKKLWLEKEEIRYFAETYSGFENKRRKKWGEMINEIDKLKEPCIILARDISRLSRNPTDSQWIMDRLYWDNKHKIKIDKIYTLDYENIKEWNRSTDKDEVHKVLSAWYYDSLDTRRKSIGGILLKLENWEFPYKAPKGLESFMQWTKRVLRQNDKMPFVRKAFEMKVEWITHKEISKYLKKYWEIKLSDRELTDRLFKNTMYIWEYTEKTTWLHYPQENTKPFLFAEWVPPIKRDLWEKVQRTFGRKNSQYWELQEWDILAEKLRTESWKRMSKYLAKWKYPNYKNTIDKINISEWKILEDFVWHIRNYIQISYEKIIKIILDRQNEARQALEWIKEWDSLKSLIVFENVKFNWGKINIWDTNISLDWIHTRGKVTNCYIDSEGDLNFELCIPEWNELIKDKNEQKRALEIANIALSFFIEKDFSIKNTSFQNEKNEQIKKLEMEKWVFEEKKKNYRRNAVLAGFTKEEIEMESKDMDLSIKIIEEKIAEFSENTDMEKYLQRLPEVLLKTFELTSNALYEKEIKGIKDDIIKLVELTTFELTINNEKELKIKLFEVLDRLISSDNYVVEVLTGSNLRTFIENYDRVAEKYNFIDESNIREINSW